MSEFIFLNGPWFWFILAGLLLLGELMSPGVFLIWIAGAAALTGVADAIIALDWHFEIIVFGLLSLALVYLSWDRVKAQRQPKSDQPYLNQRHMTYVGRVVGLEQAIVNGSGKVRIDDALWDVDGADAPKGARVKITGVNGLRLTAEVAG
jgi:inner membrane protein